MNMEKLTDRSQGFIQSAQSLAARNSNQFLTPEHLLKVMLDDKQGMASSLIAQTGADVEKVRESVNADVEKLPRVEGNAVQISGSQRKETPCRFPVHKVSLRYWIPPNKSPKKQATLM